MANRNQRKASELRGLSIYQDPKKGTIYYDWLTKKGYQLTSSDVGTYSLSQAFLPVAIVLAYGLYRFFSMDIKNAIIGGIIGLIVGGATGTYLSYKKYNKIKWSYVLIGGVFGVAIGCLAGYGIGTFIGAAGANSAIGLSSQVSRLIRNAAKLKYTKTVAKLIRLW